MAVALQQWEQYNTHALAARDVAAVIARGASQRLHILSIYACENLSTSGLSPELAARHREDMILRTRDLMERKMDEYVAPLKQKDLDVITVVQEGTPREDIVLTAARLKADLLIIGSHSKRGLFDITLGGTAQHVSRYAPCPVVLVSPNSKNDKDVVMSK
jgi:nucleotide-binding universal stress UspA family protein